MENQDAQRLAEKLFEAANSKAISASKVGLAWSVALVLLWLGTLEPVVPTLNSLYDKTRKERTASERLTGFRQSEFPGTVADREKRLAKLEKRSTATKEERRKALRKAKVSFSVPGFPSFDVRIRFASLVWNALLFGLLAYLVNVRGEVLRLVGRAAYLLSTEVSTPIRRPPVAILLPWWVSPLPVRDGKSVSSEEFRQLAGWDHRRGARLFVVFGWITLCCALQLRVASIGLSAILDLGYYSEPRWWLLYLVAFSLAIILATFVVAVLWVRRQAVPDAPAEDRRGPAVRRRVFLAAIAGISLTSLGIGAWGLREPRRLTRWIRSPRYRRRKRPPLVTLALSSGFYTNRRSRIIHYIAEAEAAPSGSARAIERQMVGVRLRSRNGPRAKNFLQLADPFAVFHARMHGDPSAHVNQGARRRIIEVAASEAWRSGDREKACNLLQETLALDLNESSPLQRGRADMRLYYQLAKYALTSGQPHRVSKMVHSLRSAGLTGEFQDAIRSWTNPKSRWRKRLTHER